jgi:hypothetical protein
MSSHSVRWDRENCRRWPRAEIPVADNDPVQILLPNGGVVTSLRNVKGDFLRFAVTEDELAAARAPIKLFSGPRTLTGGCAKPGRTEGLKNFVATKLRCLLLCKVKMSLGSF